DKSLGFLYCSCSVHACTTGQANAIQLCKHVKYFKRTTHTAGVTSERTCRCFHILQCCRSHLTTCHTINCIVYEYYGNILTPVCSVDCFSSTNCGKVAITLVCEYHFIRKESFCRSGNSGSATMSSFLPVNIKIVIRKYCTTNRCNSNCFLLKSKLFYNLRNYFMYYSMRTARAVVHIIF